MNVGYRINDRGHALLCAMVLLILMAILATSGLRSSLLETRIAQSERQRELAFQQAESVLLYAERELISPHIRKHINPPDMFLPVSYSAPTIYHAADPSSDQVLRPPGITIRTIAMNQNLVTGLGTVEPGHHTASLLINVTTYSSNGHPAIQLQSIVRRGME